MNATADGTDHVFFVDGPSRPDRQRAVEFLLVLAGVTLALATVAGAAASVALGYTLDPVAVGTATVGVNGDPVGTASADSTTKSLRTEVHRLETALAGRTPRRVYVVIDRHNNRLWLRRGPETKLEAVVSTGSGTILKESRGAQRSWTFDTPSGRFEVLSERRNPIWTKPDWAFLEEGHAPPRSLAERRERGSLGEWALDLGDGYMIHGTLYERLLGRSITHGCIRVGRDDLRVVASTVGPGTPVYIY